MNPSIQIQNLGKCYRLNHSAERQGYKTLRESVGNLGRSVFRRMRADSCAEDFWALDDVSFDVLPGEVVGIIGRNGAGKSTLLKLLSRITKPSRGRAVIEGRVGSLLEVGTGFHPELTGRENIYLNGSILGMKRREIDRQFDAIVDFAGIEKFLDTPVKRYSSGMYVRLAFAVAAHLEPEILIVDEVLAVGDAQFQKKSLGKMRDVAREGRTVLFVSHNMSAIATMCQRVVWLDQGRIALQGGARQMVSAYLQAGAETRGEQVWDDPADAPGNDQVRFQRVRISGVNKPADEPLTIATPIRVEVEYWNYVDAAMLNVTAFLYNIEGETIFASAGKSCGMPSGLLRSSFIIPANFLNDGTYRIKLMIVGNSTTLLSELDSTVMFEMRELARDGEWFGKWPGAVRPLFDWTTQVVAAEESFASARVSAGGDAA